MKTKKSVIVRLIVCAAIIAILIPVGFATDLFDNAPSFKHVRRDLDPLAGVFRMRGRDSPAQLHHCPFRHNFFLAYDGIVCAISTTQDQVFNLLTFRLAGSRPDANIDAIQSLRLDMVRRIASRIDIDNKHRLPFYSFAGE